MEMTKDNMEIYELVRAVPGEALRKIEAGRLKGFSDINPMWRIKTLTEVFGPCGIGWWYRITDKRLEGSGEEIRAFVDIELFYVWGGKTSQPVVGTGGASFLTREKNGPYISDECFKMALTDAISVAAKALGVGADVYYAKDRDKYTTQEEKPEPEKKPAPEKTPEAKPEQEKKPEPRQSADGYYYCNCCGGRIFPHGKVSDHAVALKSLEQFGKQLCVDCAVKERARSGY